MRFLLRILVFTALICGGVVYYFWDSPILQQTLPLSTKAKPEETVHIYALRLVDQVMREKKPTDYGSMQRYYLQAVESKYHSLVGYEKQLGLKDFLESEKTARIAVWLRRLDADSNGKVEQNEWDDDFSFISHDINEDGSVDGNEYWQTIARDIGEQFLKSDLDHSTDLSLTEYIELKGGEAEAKKFADDFDFDGNNYISNKELNDARHRYGYY